MILAATSGFLILIVVPAVLIDLCRRALGPPATFLGALYAFPRWSEVSVAARRLRTIYVAWMVASVPLWLLLNMLALRLSRPPA